MRRIVFASATAVLIAAGLAAPQSAGAAPRPTISGPTVVPYYALVTLHGTTPQPNQDVEIFFEAAGEQQFTARRHLQSDAAGKFSTSYHAAKTQAYYAHVQGADSAVDHTQIVTADCTISQPVFSQLPIPDRLHSKSFPDFAAFTATNGRLWAGINADMDSGRFAVISWRTGQNPKVLDEFRYRGHPFRASYYSASVRVVGVSPHGAVVAAVQRTDHDNSETGFVWVHGNRHELRQLGTWRSAEPTGVAADGSIIGFTTFGSRQAPKHDIVRWTPNGRHVETVVHWRSNGFKPAVDSTGNIAFNAYIGARVRRASGNFETLPGYTTGGRDPNRQVTGVGGRRTFYGITDVGTVRWDLHDLGHADVTLLAGRRLEVFAAGRRGDVILGDHARPRERHLRTASGAFVKMPRELGLYAANTIILSPAGDPARNHRVPLYSPGAAIDDHGRVAFTSARDNLVHFLRCT